MSQGIGDEKKVVLQKHGLLNPNPEKVKDYLFEVEDFFDPYDLLQVKYEMIRRVQRDGISISRAASMFGFSRTAFYQMKATFEESGIAGLLPQKRGPKNPHKLTKNVTSYIQDLLQEEPGIKSEEIAERVTKTFQISIHPRTIEKNLMMKKKL